jgi:hypothetical protein
MAMLFAVSASDPAAARQKPACNGAPTLCGRRLDRVAFPATHNSMSSEVDGFQGPNQARPIADQLEAGIRAFLVDVYTGTPTTDHICTDPTPLKVAQIERESGTEALDQLLAIRNAQCPPAGGPDAGLYLCHGFCELGAVPFVAQLTTIREFLDQHPDDVVALILEDYSPAGDIMAAFREAGLEDQLVAHEMGAPWPRLRRLVKADTRLVVFAQHQGGTAPGLLAAWREMSDTPYSFRSEADFTCARNRGPRDARLFLLNHWIAASDARAAAARVNSESVLGERAHRCMRARGHIPNFVAVDYAEEGDLLRVVDDLNRLGERTG